MWQWQTADRVDRGLCLSTVEPDCDWLNTFIKLLNFCCTQFPPDTQQPTPFYSQPHKHTPLLCFLGSILTTSRTYTWTNHSLTCSDKPEGNLIWLTHKDDTRVKGELTGCGCWLYPDSETDGELQGKHSLSYWGMFRCSTEASSKAPRLQLFTASTSSEVPARYLVVSSQLPAWLPIVVCYHKLIVWECQFHLFISLFMPQKSLRFPSLAIKIIIIRRIEKSTLQKQLHKQSWKVLSNHWLKLSKSNSINQENVHKKWKQISQVQYCFVGLEA